MRVLKFILISLIAFQFVPLPAKATNPPASEIDIQSYAFTIELSDTTNRIYGDAIIIIKFNESVTGFSLDLVNEDASGAGMKVLQAWENGKPSEFKHTSNKLFFPIQATNPGEKREYRIQYAGIPADGLIIGKNLYGERTFFGDNWPDRAHHWLPCIDHPLDKAFVSFTVIAPNHYQVISNGFLFNEINISNELNAYVWRSSVVLPTKVMVIGAAPFAVQNLGEVEGIPLSSWVYPQNAEAGFHDYAVAAGVLEFFVDSLGDFPFEKLANVQSTTRYGGMENAGCIFYAETSVTGRQTSTDLIAHEVAHQWFGNSATEADWSHLWLSEGFATYLANVYLEHTDGSDALQIKMRKEREQVIQFYRYQKTPVIDTFTSDYTKLLNANAYQKGSWLLHMLRREIGDRMFWNVLRTYYQRFKFSNATSADFREVVEEVSNRELGYFFDQWLHMAGHPVLAFNEAYAEGKMVLEVHQKQRSQVPFRFTLDILLKYHDGSQEKFNVQMENLTDTFSLDVKEKPISVVLDPEAWLLFEKF